MPCFTASGSRSRPIAFLPRVADSMRVVPEPIIGSRTVSPGIGEAFYEYGRQLRRELGREGVDGVSYRRGWMALEIEVLTKQFVKRVNSSFGVPISGS